jgi:FKBP-type peptidyl-prolyl cis-trans isomerase
MALCRQGGKRLITIPPDIGCGSSGASGVIAPNAALIFEVELIGVD